MIPAERRIGKLPVVARDNSRHYTVGYMAYRNDAGKVQTVLSNLCGSSCPLESVGTLRRIRLSGVSQKGPRLPALPK
ncbi:MAG TPA: hypothetical protein VG605_09725 [Puia sp.]|nr:hypothetical protein [Puia sp.]